jgi:hypothetical protein
MVPTRLYVFPPKKTSLCVTTPNDQATTLQFHHFGHELLAAV